MAKIYTSAQDEMLIETILARGLRAKAPKWTVLRLALAKSLALPTPPDESLRREAGKGGEYSLEQATGQGQGEKLDFTEPFRALLALYHNEDLFSQEERFRDLLELHVRRGLREFRAGWRDSHDFHEYLLQELFAGQSGEEEGATTDEALAKALREIGVQAEIRGRVEGVRLTRYLLHLPDVNHLDKVKRGLDKMAFSLGLGGQAIFQGTADEPKTLTLDIPRPAGTWKRYTGADFREWLNTAPQDWALPVFPGVDVLGKPYGFDLATAPHLLVGGTTGSGKSVCLHALLQSILLTRTPEEVRVLLIDPKAVEFNAYAQARHLLTGDRVLTQPDEALEALEELVVEMEARHQQFARIGARDIGEARGKGQHLYRVVVFVEELADLILRSGAVEDALVRLAQKARSAGIHLVLATQRPDSQTFSGLLRSNIPARIALTVQKASESKIILDETGAEALTGRGDMLVRLAGETPIRVHGVLLTRDDAAYACKKSKEAP